MHSKKVQLILLACFILFCQQSFAQSNHVDTSISIHKGQLSYTEASKSTTNEITVDLISGTILITSNSQNIKSDTAQYKFKPENFNITAEIIHLNTDFSQPNVKSLFSSIQSKGCGITAGRILDLAKRMIKEDHNSNNEPLVMYGRLLRNIASRMFQDCMIN